MRRRRELRRVAALALVAVALLLSAGASGADEPSTGAAGWESLLGDRPTAQLGNRWVVVLAKPSLASHVLAAGGHATEERERGWTVQARRDQRDVLARLAFRGAPIEPEHSFLRVFNGFAAPLDARSLAIVQNDPDVKGVYPVRTAVPAAVDPRTIDDLAGAAGGRRANLGIPGFTGSGVTVALLDTGVDLVHPYIRPALVRGLDVLDPFGDASARQNPTAAWPPGAPWHGDGGPRRRLGRPGGAAGRRAGCRAAADPRRRMAAGRCRRCLRLRPHRSGPGRDGAGRRSQLRRRCPRRRAGHADRRRRALCGLPGQPAQPGRVGRRGARLARDRTGRERRAGGPGVRQHRRPRRRRSGAHRRRDRHAPPQPHRPCASARRAARARLGRAAPRRRRRPRALRQRPRRRAVALDAGDRRRGRRPRAPLRHAPASAASAAPRCCSRAGRRHRSPCARSSRPVRAPSSSTGRCPRARSAPTALPTFRSSGSRPPPPTRCERRCGSRSRSRSPSARLPSTRTPTAARRRRSPPKGSRSTAARSPR